MSADGLKHMSICGEVDLLDSSPYFDRVVGDGGPNLEIWIRSGGNQSSSAIIPGIEFGVTARMISRAVREVDEHGNGSTVMV